MSLLSSVHDLKTLILSFHPVVAVETVEEERLRHVLRSVSDQLGMRLFEWSITRGLTRGGQSAGVGRTTEPLRLLSHIAEVTVQAVYLLKDFSRHLDDAATARQFRETADRFSQRRSTMVLSGETVKLPAEIEHRAARYELALPGSEELRDILRKVVESLKASSRLEISLTRQEYEEIVRALSGMTLNQARQVIAYAILEDGKLDAEDIHGILERKAQVIRDGGLLEYFPAEDNRWQLGGFANLKRWLERARVGFSEEAQRLNLKPPRGILITGVQGCGKSLAAKFIARQWRLPLLKLDAGRLFDKYIGESEKNFRKAIALAESIAPVVLWIDEIEKGMSTRGSGEADAGLSRRLFGAFLTWLQEKTHEVFVAAVANDLSCMPPELLRKGRFDEAFFVDLPQAAEREEIFKIHLALRKQEPAAFDLARLVPATEGFSGAEIEQAVIAALYRALYEKKPLSTELLLGEASQAVPLSVSRREDIEALREMARGRFVSVC